MASFADSISEILSLLGKATPLLPNPNSREFPPGTFAAVVFALLDRLTDAKTADAILDFLGESDDIESNDIDPADIAQRGPTDLRDRLADNGIRLGPKEALLVVRLANWLTAHDPESTGTEAIRDDLRAISGIGPATGDALLLYGFDRAAYPVDRPSYRILVRHGWIDPTAEYDEARSTIESPIGDDVSALVLLSQSFEAIGRQFCRVGSPRCDRCPLRPFLPASGPYDPSS